MVNYGIKFWGAHYDETSINSGSLGENSGFSSSSYSHVCIVYNEKYKQTKPTFKMFSLQKVFCVTFLLYYCDNRKMHSPILTMIVDCLQKNLFQLFSDSAFIYNAIEELGDCHLGFKICIHMSHMIYITLTFNLVIFY